MERKSSRRPWASLAAILLVTTIVRNAAVASLANSRASEAAKFWSAHPAVEVSLAMAAIAQNARVARPPPSWTFGVMADAAAKDPLAPEPYLVRGVRAQLAGDSATAQGAFEAAQWRDPRSLPAANFLADRYFRIGDARRGLFQVAALARQSPNGTAIIAPYLTGYTRDSANWPALRTMFAANPELATAALVGLASDVSTIPAVVALAGSRPAPGQALWLPRLLGTLTSAGQYEKAQQIWARAFASGTKELVHDASFTDKLSPPPFNWTLTSSAVGLAERQPGGRLHVLFYGQEDGILASQLLLLPPGEYRISMKVVGDPSRAGALNWSVWCDKSDAAIISITLEGASRGRDFEVPAGCPRSGSSCRPRRGRFLSRLTSQSPI